MRHIFIIALLPLLPVAAMAGGPSIRCRSASVEYVAADQFKIVMIVNGRCELFLSDENQGENRARMIDTDMRHCAITIVRNDVDGSGYTNWDEHCEKARSLAGKKARLDLQGTITIDQAQVAAVRATTSGFGQPEAAAGPRDE